MVLKYEHEEEIWFIDATMEGVSVLPWNSLWQYKDAVYEWIAVRKLAYSWDEDPDFLVTLEKFID